MLDLELSLSLILARNENAANFTSAQFFLVALKFTADQIPYHDRVLLLSYFWSLLRYLKFLQEILKRADELQCARTRAQTGTKLVVNRK